MNQFLSLVLVRSVKLGLLTQPTLVRLPKCDPTLHIVEDRIVDVIGGFLQ